jgi:regulatory protein
MSTAYVAALKLLARRELSEAQVRQRLARKGFEGDTVDEAIAKLKAERAIDDARVAEAIARTETAVKRRGKLRVRRQIESAGISSAEARRAVNEAFEDLDPNALLEAALAKRLRAAASIKDDREFRRLYRFLVGQGFDSDQVMRILDKRRKY